MRRVTLRLAFSAVNQVFASIGYWSARAPSRPNPWRHPWPNAGCHHRPLLQTLKDWFDAFITSPGATADPHEAEHLLQLATAVMLVDVMRADASFRTGERELARTVLVENFALTDDEAARLAELGETTASQATDLFGSTSRINDHFDMP